jgi:hypothetical protein
VVDGRTAAAVHHLQRSPEMHGEGEHREQVDQLVTSAWGIRLEVGLAESGKFQLV